MICRGLKKYEEQSVIVLETYIYVVPQSSILKPVTLLKILEFVVHIIYFFYASKTFKYFMHKLKCTTHFLIFYFFP